MPVSQWGIKIITEKFVRDMHSRDAVVMVWTINDSETMRKLFSIDVDTVMTDDPRLLIKTAEEMGIR